MSPVTAEAHASRAVRKDGRAFLHAVESSLRWLETNAKAVDRLNVFPVPDGDTGTNMTLTLRAALEHASTVQSDAVGDVTAALARGALLGARGNSGVILSQIIRGLAEGLAGLNTFTPQEFAAATQRAYQVAYESITQPVEGTILTVARDLSHAAVARCASATTLEEVIEHVVEAARTSVDDTPNHLPVLKEAGVVDAGGQGLFLIFEGMLRYFRGEPLPAVATSDRASHVFSAFAEAHRTDEHGYCTEFLIHGADLDAGAVREVMTKLGQSLLVVGDATLVRVHVHTDKPDAAIAAALRFGQLDRVKADNMDLQQAANFADAKPGDGQPTVASRSDRVAPAPVVAVAVGDGITKVFESLGTSVVHGGQSMNPSAGEILKAIEASPADWAVVLPNNGNVILAARTAASQTSRTVHIVPTRSVPQGIAAALAFNPSAGQDENVRAMTAAADAVTTLEVTRAVRDAVIGDLRITRGQYIGLVNDRLVAGDSDVNALVVELFKRLDTSSSEIVTLYLGKDADRAQSDVLVRELTARYPGVEFETVDGGQGLYDYVISVE